MSRGHEEYYTREQSQKVVDHLSRQRWIDAENGTFARGSHEIPFDRDGDVAPAHRVLPETPRWTPTCWRPVRPFS
ncbi:hypothetical protein [Streptomyces sp. NPDC020571]|uniref:hypothetical protein n=1 Tax=Streptomyces sp. NPDC020571 TaxID=3365079 RepID=UPI0037AFD3C9